MNCSTVFTFTVPQDAMEALRLQPIGFSMQEIANRLPQFAGSLLKHISNPDTLNEIAGQMELGGAFVGKIIR